MQACNPEALLYRRKPQCKVSVILLDWGVRESFHSLDYLNNQTADRDSYELIWLEFYDRRPDALREKALCRDSDAPMLDKWLVAGYSSDTIFNKHRLYNMGLLLAEGDICVICDSDAIFTEHFIERIVKEFTGTANLVLHLDEIRNDNRQLYPFCYPTMAQIMGEGCTNWHETVSRGLNNNTDMIHAANYGACMASRRSDLIAIGGADEHIDYLGYICGPYEMTFRLVNAGFEERWLRDEYIYHTWHPNQSGINGDYQGPHDGKYMSLRALDTRATKRVRPWIENPWIAEARDGNLVSLNQLLERLRSREETSWQVQSAPKTWNDAYCMEMDHDGFNTYYCKGRWYGLPVDAGRLEPSHMSRYRTLLKGKCLEEVHQLIEYYNQLPPTMWGRIWSGPLYRLPLRALKRLQREVARVMSFVQ